MEEKILVQSKQYNIKKTVTKISCAIIVLSIIVSIFTYISYYSEIVNKAKSDYEEYYLPGYEERVAEYNDILKDYETKNEKTIYCDHAKHEIKYYYSSGKKLKPYEETLPMSKSEFLEAHPDVTAYIECKGGHAYENFKEYKNAQVKSNLGSYERGNSALPLLANLLIPIIFLVYLWLRSYSLTITDKRVYGKTAFGKRVDLPLDSVSSVGTSALKGVAVGTSSGKINFKLIKNQSEIHDVISKLLAERQKVEKTATETTVNQTIVETSSADEIKKYKDLLDSGIITQEEFDEKKKQLLNL